MAEDDRPTGSDPNERDIVVGVDGSVHARLALAWAADEARRRASLLRVVFAEIDDPKHVPGWYTSGSSPMSPGEAIVDEAVGLVATRHPSVLVRGEVVKWPAAMVLTSASRSAGLVVVGSRGRGGFDELVLGSVSDQCIQYAHCPVAVVHAGADDPVERSGPPRIVVGIDGSLGSTRALRWALDEAQILSASVEAVFVWQLPPIHAVATRPQSGFDVVAKEIAEAASDHAEQLAPSVPFAVTTCSGATVPALLDAGRGAEMLVVGEDGHGGFEGAILGSIAHQCARHATGTVVVVRPRRFL
jgi:nucleotide-binding universal stress UspA family protein